MQFKFFFYIKILNLFLLYLYKNKIIVKILIKQ